VVPFDYLRLPAVALIAYLVFGEQPGFWTWVGGAVIAASGIYMTYREAQLRRDSGRVPVAAAGPDQTTRSAG
jgi:drug/metabolite transporter (DMT)-like permease